MTDAEIIKIMERCAKDEMACCKCPFNDGSIDCSDGLVKKLYGVISRQQAVIDGFTMIGKLYSEIKAEAVKEFAEVMKENLKNVAKEEIMGREYYLIGLSFIDNLVKEFDKDINVRTNPEQVKGE